MIVTNRKDYYNQAYVLHNLLDQLKYTYLSGVKKNEKGKNVLSRYYLGYNLDLLKDSLRRLNAYEDTTVKLYFDLTRWEKDGNIPMFSYNQKVRKEDKERFNKEYEQYMANYSFGIDIDSDSLKIAHRDTKAIKKLFDQYKLPYSVKFSVTGETKVLIKNKKETKLISIKEVVSLLKKGEEIEIFSLDNNYEPKFSKVYDYLEHIDKVYEIYYSLSKNPIKSTKHHSIYVLRNYEIQEIKVEDLKVRDYLITFNKKNKNKNLPKNIEFGYNIKVRNKVLNVKDKIKIDNNLLRLIGYYIGDGHISSNNNIGFSFNVNEKDFIRDVSKILKKLTHSDYFYNESKKIEKMKKNGLRRKDIIKSTKLSECFVENVLYNNKKPKIRMVKFHYFNPNIGTTQINLNSVKWWNFFNLFCGRGSKNKKLPNFVWNLNKEQVLEILQGYINSDGYKKGKYSYSFKSVSRELIVQWCWLLKMNGISCRISYEQIRPHTLPQGNKFKGSFVYKLEIPKQELGKREVHKFSHLPTERLLPTKGLKEIYHQCKPKKFNKHRKEEMTLKKELGSRERISNVLRWFKEFKSIPLNKNSKEIIKKYEKLINSEIGIVKVKKIQENKCKKVYDVSVENTENFFGGEYPILLHNSGQKGFHFIIHYRYFDGRIKAKNKVLLCQKLSKVIMNVCKLKSITEGGTFDDTIYDDRRIFKLAYSLQNKDGQEYCVLPLDDYQFENWKLEDMELSNVMKKVKLFKRGLLTRTYGLSDKQLRNNLRKFIKECK